MKGHPVTHFPTVGFMLHLISQVRNLRAPSCEDPIFFLKKTSILENSNMKQQKQGRGCVLFLFFLFFLF